jgi:hypothetical protein
MIETNVHFGVTVRVLVSSFLQFPSMSSSSIAAQALYAYQGRSDAELSFDKDAIITNVAMLEGVLRL